MTVDHVARAVPRLTASRTLALAIGLGALCLAPAGAVARKPLPAFTVTDLQSRTVESADLVREGNWLLVYLQAGCDGCGELLQLLDAKALPDAPLRTVIVVGGMDERAVASAATAFPHLASARWLADPDRTLARVLPAASAPVVFGLHAQMLEWSIAGLVPSVSAVRSALVTWIGRAP